MTEKFEIVSISWERLYLSLDVRSESSHLVEFAFKNIKTGKKTSFLHTLLENDIYRIRVNLSTIEPSGFLENGKWVLCAYTSDESYECSVSEETALQFDDLSRIFRYGHLNYSYTVTFSVRTDNIDSLFFVMHSVFMKVNKHWKRRDFFEGGGFGPQIIKGLFKYCYLGFTCFIYKFFRFFSFKKEKNILMMSDSKIELSGNLKAIDERLKYRGLDKEYHISYYFNKNKVRKLSRFTERIKQIKLISKQNFIFVDDVSPTFYQFNLDPKVILVQVWHAGGGFKAVGYARFGKNGTPYPFRSFHRKYTHAICPSENLAEVFQEMFGISEEKMVPTGMPRADGFLNEIKMEEYTNYFYKENPQMINKKIILFAPTFRGNGETEATYDFDIVDLDRIFDFCGEEYVFIIKMHPFIKASFEIPERVRSRIFNFSKESNINDLFYVTDLLITDYSSCYYEFALLNKPMLFFTYDRVLYELTRGVYQDVKLSAPGKVCDSFEELVEALINKDYEYWKVAEFIKNNFGDTDKNASDEVIDRIILSRTDK